MAENKTRESLGEVHSSVRIPTGKNPWKKFLAFVGPAYLVGVGYMDPGNWATDLAGGSKFGYSLIWILLMSNLMALLLQTLSARLGIIRGLDLAQASRNTYPSVVNIPLYILAEIAIVATDLAEVIGMAIGLQLLFGLPLIAGVSITVLDTILILFLMNKGIRIMEIFIVSMVSIIGLSFLAEMIIAKPQVSEIISGFEPSLLSGEALYIAIGIIGATVMPHNLYLHSSLVQTRKVERTKGGIRDALKFNFLDTALALNLAFFVNAAILILAATAFFKNGIIVDEIQDAHRLLDDIFGSVAPTLFAIALIASGQSSTITGTLAGQIVMEGYLNLRMRVWLRRLITRMLAITPAFFTIIYFGDEALGGLLVLSQVVLSLQLGFAVIPLIHFNSDRVNMREYTIKTWVKILAWTAAVVIVGLNVKLVAESIGGWIGEAENPVYLYIFVIPLAVVVGMLLLYVTFGPLIMKERRSKRNIPHGEAVSIVQPEKFALKRIALTIDFSKNDRDTIRYALMQGGREANYLLIHIVESAGARYMGREIRDFETRSDEENIIRYVENVRALGYTAEYRIGYGKTAPSIARIIREDKCDFLVMGAHGHRALKDIIFGTTVDAVRHLVKVPVLIVRKED